MPLPVIYPAQKIKTDSQKNKPWAYPPLPPNHMPPIKKVSFANFAQNDDLSSKFFTCPVQNGDSDCVEKIVNKYDVNEYDHESSDEESVCTNNNEFVSKLQGQLVNVEGLEELCEDNIYCRIRGGCGPSCSCAKEGLIKTESQRSIKNLNSAQKCIESPKNNDNCSVNNNQNISRAQLSTVNGSSHSFSTVESRPICIKSSRCSSPCRSENPGCGGGGCYSGGCRGGCGKPGQLCMLLKTCGASTFRGHSFVSRPHWSLSKSDIPQAASQCRTETACRQSDISVHNHTQLSCAKNTDEYDNCKRSSRSKTGCECLGGGLNCQRCGHKVYQAEMMIAAGSPYHNICFSCYCCRKPLEPLTYQENCGEIYCKQCLIRNFGPQGYGYGVGAGVLQTPI